MEVPTHDQLFLVMDTQRMLGEKERSGVKENARYQVSLGDCDLGVMIDTRSVDLCCLSLQICSRTFLNVYVRQPPERRRIARPQRSH